MTLLIAWILIDAYHLGDGMKTWAAVLWVLHIGYHQTPSAQDIVDKLRGKK